VPAILIFSWLGSVPIGKWWCSILKLATINFFHIAPISSSQPSSLSQVKYCRKIYEYSLEVNKCAGENEILHDFIFLISAFCGWCFRPKATTGLTLISLEIQIKNPENVSEKKMCQNDR